MALLAAATFGQTESPASETANVSVQTVSYTEGSQGERLAWLPYRPVQPAVDHGRSPEELGLTRVQYEQPRTLAANQASDAVADPFGDRYYKPDYKKSISKNRSRRSASYVSQKPVRRDSAVRQEPTPAARKAPPAPKAFESKTLPSLSTDQSKSKKSTSEFELPGLSQESSESTPSGDATPPMSSQEISDFSVEPVIPTPPELGQPTPKGLGVPGGISKGEKVEVPLFEQEWAANIVPDETCPEGQNLKPIGQVTTDITSKKGIFPKPCKYPAGPFPSRDWGTTTFTWKASGLCHKPLYFEDLNLERYGHSWGPYVQPVVSQAHFFLTVPILPYKMGLKPPGECIYSLGYYRPGSCAPHKLDPIPLSVRAGLIEAGVWVGAAAVIP